jgi:hypothetical protein
VPTSKWPRKNPLAAHKNPKKCYYLCSNLFFLVLLVK